MHPPPPPPPLPALRPAQTPPQVSTRPKHSSSTFNPLTHSSHSTQSQKSTSSPPFQPCHIFVYGTLMDPQVLQSLLALPSPPTLQPAILSDFRVKMWGIYPALVPSLSGAVEGFVWHVDLLEHFERLVEYETSAYRWTECVVEIEDGERLGRCRVFVWAGEEDSKELEEGEFDFERWKRYFKGSVVRG